MNRTVNIYPPFLREKAKSPCSIVYTAHSGIMETLRYEMIHFTFVVGNSDFERILCTYHVLVPLLVLVLVLFLLFIMKTMISQTIHLTHTSKQRRKQNNGCIVLNMTM